MTEDTRSAKPLNEDMDAQRWAREFIELWKGHPVGGICVDEGLMISWFANAIMCGHDNARWEYTCPVSGGDVQALPRIPSQSAPTMTDEQVMSDQQKEIDRLRRIVVSGASIEERREAVRRIGDDPDRLDRFGDRMYPELEIGGSSIPSSTQQIDGPRGAYEPLEPGVISTMCRHLLEQHELHPLTPGNIRKLCAMAHNSLLYAEEIQRLRGERTPSARGDHSDG